MRGSKKILLLAALGLAGVTLAPRTGRPAPPASERTVRLPVTRDTWFANVPGQEDCNLGGASRLKLKSYQEMSLFDVNPEALRGRVVRRATLHLRHASGPPLRRVTVSSFAADWVEGTSPSYDPQKGSSTFRHRKYPEVPWAVPGGDLCAVALGQGGTVWRMADASPPDRQGWQTVAVEPAVVAARVAGISYGFLLFDDTGREWSRQGERFEMRPFPNRYVSSREAGTANAPFLSVVLGPEDRRPPAAPGELRWEVKDLPAGEAWVSWVTPKDEGEAGTVGFFVQADGKEVPRYLIPRAGKVGERVRLHLRDLGLRPGAEVRVEVRAVDGAGNVGPATMIRGRVSDREAAPLPGNDPKPFAGRAPLPRLGGAEVAVVDELDKIQPVTGALIPEQPRDYLAANHLWSARTRQVRLHAARNEFVAFQVVLHGAIQNVRPALTFAGKDGDRFQVALGRYHYVASAKGPLPDPIVPLRGPLSVPAREQAVEGQKYASLHCEIYVPHEAAAGEHRGKLTLRAGDETLTLNVDLHVWDFTLPDYLSFLPEMNCYGLPANERDYYRLAHRHRTVLNAVPYTQGGAVHDGWAPRWDGERLDWSAWDQRFGPYFDGSAFADLPRRRVPLECFYLPLHENWPDPMAGNYNGSYWADRAFPARYRRDFVEATRQVAAHCNARGWGETFFQCFLNNKVHFKRNGWSRGSSPWDLDEPGDFQDFWALRYFGAAFHEGTARAPGRAKLVFRCDVSRPEWQRNALDGLLDYNVVSGAMRRYHRLVFDRKEAQGQVVLEYGGSNAVEEPNTQPAGWCLDAWALGCDGVLPWQTLGRADSWDRADRLALFYPGRGRDAPPVPSVRLKAYRRGQQDVEYLTLLGQLKGEPRWALGRRVREALRLVPMRRGTGFQEDEDAGVVSFARLRPQDLWALRLRVGQVLSEARPKPKRRLVELRTPPRHPDRLEPGYVSTEPVARVESRKPVPPKDLVTKVLQGRAAVRDVLLDPNRPDRKLGAEPRGNAVSKGKESGAFLVRFDLGKLGLPRGAKVWRATVSFYVWDPSSTGNTRVGAFPVKTAWTEAEATWKQSAAGRAWRGGKHFTVGTDTGPASSHVIVRPDQDTDTVDPPLEYRLDVTDLVRSWLAGAPNHGVAIIPVPDRSVDDGLWTRFQVYASEFTRTRYTPRLTVSLETRVFGGGNRPPARPFRSTHYK